MIGKRVEEYEDTPGAYWQHEGVWYGVTPNGILANLANHKITEHADGTITATPSIACGKNVNAEGKIVEPYDWHGFLELGVWRSV